MTKSEFNEIWIASAAMVTMKHMLRGQDLSVEQYFTYRIRHVAPQFRSKYGLTKEEVLELIKRHEGISQREFDSLYLD